MADLVIVDTDVLIVDALIAATALSPGIPSITKNRGDYRFIAGLHLLPYPQPFAA